MISFTAQIWDGQTLLSAIGGLSIDAAREICRAAPTMGHSGRVWCDDDGTDYNEVYAKDGSIRRGKFEETTLVVIAQREG
jgi:hypothetical protein